MSEPILLYRRSSLFRSAAACALLTGICGTLSTANAEIGLYSGMPGQGYCTLLGGYQFLDGGDAVAPIAIDNNNPFPNGVDAEGLAIATPHATSVEVGIESGNRSAGAEARASDQTARTDVDVEQIIGDAHGEGSAAAEAIIGSSAASSVVATQSDPNNLATSAAAAQGTAGTPAEAAAATGTFVDNNGTTDNDADADADVGNPANAAAASAAAVAPVTANAAAAAAANTDTAAAATAGTAEVDATHLTSASAAATAGPAIAAAATAATTQINGSTASVAAAANTTSAGQAAAAATTLSGVGGISASASNTDGQAIALLTVGPPARAVLTKLDAEDGGFAGLSCGYAFRQGVAGFFDRIEGYGTFARNRDSGALHPLNFLWGSDDGRVAVQAFNTAGLNVPHHDEVKQREFGLRFKSDRMAHGRVPLVMSLESFYVDYEQEAGFGLAGVFNVNAQVDGDLFGAQLALESELPLIANRLHWVGRMAGGLYYLDADGHFTDTLGGAAVKDSLNEDGYRLGAETGLRVFLSPSHLLTFTGAVDHYSDVPVAVFGDALTGTASHVKTDDLTTYRAVVRLTVRTPPSPAP
jgi:hypothetical protein